MTTTEHLSLIESKCEANLDYLQLCRSGGALITKIDLLAEAGWKSTLAAIEGLRKLALETELYPGHGGSPNVLRVIDAIIAAWPIELLQ